MVDGSAARRSLLGLTILLVPAPAWACRYALDVALTPRQTQHEVPAPRNAVPWVTWGSDGLTLVDGRGAVVPITVETTATAPDALLAFREVHPERRLRAGAYEIVADGVGIGRFTVGERPDRRAPVGGSLTRWRWGGLDGGEWSLVLAVEPPEDQSALRWEVEAWSSAAPARIHRQRGVEYGHAHGAMPLLPDEPRDAPVIVLYQDWCTANFTFPPFGGPGEDLEFRLRWVDAAGHATAWTAVQSVPAGEWAWPRSTGPAAR